MTKKDWKIGAPDRTDDRRLIKVEVWSPIDVKISLADQSSDLTAADEQLSIDSLFDHWQIAQTPRLKGIVVGDHPKALIEDLSEAILQAFAQVKLIDPKALETKVAAQYGKLSVDEIKALVVDDKWLATIAADVQTELDRVSQALTGRIKMLAERYASPLPKLIEEVETLSARVDEHLKKMGFEV